MSSRHSINPPRGGGIRYVEPTINNTAYYKWGNYKQRSWRYPINTATDANPMARHWLCDFTYVKGLIVHQRSKNNMNQNYIKRPFTKQWFEHIYYKQITGKLPLVPWILFVYGCGCASMRSFDNTAYDYFYFSD